MEEEFSIPETFDPLTYTVDSETVKQNLHIQQKNSALSTTVPTILDPELISVCACLLSTGTGSLEDTAVTKRKQKIFSNALRTETYLRERRIPELITYILAKIMCNKPIHVPTYIAELLDKCMIFRSDLGKAPVLFEERHIEAVVKSFDPSDRGWLSAGQVRRAYTTLGLTPKSNLEVRIPTKEVLDLLRESQERELLSLLSAGTEMDDEFLE